MAGYCPACSPSSAGPPHWAAAQRTPPRRAAPGPCPSPHEIRRPRAWSAGSALRAAALTTAREHEPFVRRAAAPAAGAGPAASMRPGHHPTTRLAWARHPRPALRSGAAPAQAAGGPSHPHRRVAAHARWSRPGHPPPGSTLRRASRRCLRLRTRPHATPLWVRPGGAYHRPAGRPSKRRPRVRGCPVMRATPPPWPWLRCSHRVHGTGARTHASPPPSPE